MTSAFCFLPNGDNQVLGAEVARREHLLAEAERLRNDRISDLRLQHYSLTVEVEELKERWGLPVWR